MVVLPAKKRSETKMIDALLVNDSDQIILITDGGTLIRTEVCKIAKYSRIAAGVRLINLNEEQSLVGVAAITDNNTDEDDEISGDSNTVSQTDE